MSVVRSHKHLRRLGSHHLGADPCERLEVGSHIVALGEQVLHLSLSLRTVVEHLMLLGKQIGNLREQLLRSKVENLLVGESPCLHVLGTVHHVPVESAAARVLVGLRHLAALEHIHLESIEDVLVSHSVGDKVLGNLESLADVLAKTSD